MKQQLLNLSAKDLNGKSGIYFITCFGHQYVGSSKSLYARLREHKIKLNINPLSLQSELSLV